jgi:small subunit ribosomal protein S27
MQRIKRLEDIEKIQDEMNVKEKKLWFFENRSKIELEIQKKHRLYYPKKWYGKKKTPRSIDENYVPPEV